jgi:succinoglycan biosynthesis transport protein ExoP
MSDPTSPAIVTLRAAIEPFSATIAALWTNLIDGPMRPGEAGEVDPTLRLGFTACAHRDGTTTSALCAASSLALHGGREVVLVETSSPRGGLAEWLGCDPVPGFEEVRRGDVPVDRALRRTDLPGLLLLPAGRARPGDGGGSFRAADLRKLWSLLSGGARHVLVDAPPIPDYELAIPVLASVDETILVLNARRSGKGPTLRALRALDERGIALRGTILGRCSRNLPRWLEPRRR